MWILGTIEAVDRNLLHLKTSAIKSFREYNSPNHLALKPPALLKYASRGGAHLLSTQQTHVSISRTLSSATPPSNSSLLKSPRILDAPRSSYCHDQLLPPL
ncbi:hypothetical protein PCASD_06609 [Puccinia coronata f. sp. avenae]|uniref:Uncharacterized protein n=1 Tax=Puccinia coronata f. sp. avenae TaxID=200324 RepID=A0A2N5SLF3_9BASI|nr:hypothetical protein PCASD_19503 [Puccinia coronata f. sp. avenae]PLW40958.1 hypothetical protein PCASD_06609 [Puccinia coronata f. sp. avenae]